MAEPVTEAESMETMADLIGREDTEITMDDRDLHPMPAIHVPDLLVLKGVPDMRLSPNDMRELKAATGKTMTELTGEGADEADAMQTMAWLKLRRDGAHVRWEDCGDIALEFQEAEPDPTNEGPLTNSPGSATSGTAPPGTLTS